MEEDECILYLWQNRQTVVIGVNQNPWKEARVNELEDEGGFLARRMSGGGAVFHDLGNLNFTFLAHEANYSVTRQLNVIIRAIAGFGVRAKQSGRNDILAGNKKFSGNAFFSSRGHCYHHGTILLDVDMSRLSRYLNVPEAKLQSKGVDSVRSRVVNLKELAPDITVDALRHALVEAFGDVYGEIPLPLPEERLNPDTIGNYENKYASWQWRLGRKLPFTVEYSRRFDWGDLTLQFCIESGIIKDAIAYSDGMETKYIYAIGKTLRGAVFSSSEIKAGLRGLAGIEPIDQTALNDIIGLVNEYV
jgi:lipoate-protein ligase A